MSAMGDLATELQLNWQDGWLDGERLHRSGQWRITQPWTGVGVELFAYSVAPDHHPWRYTETFSSLASAVHHVMQEQAGTRPPPIPERFSARYAKCCDE